MRISTEYRALIFDLPAKVDDVGIETVGSYLYGIKSQLLTQTGAQTPLVSHAAFCDA
jgi:hypothetical protein